MEKKSDAIISIISERKSTNIKILHCFLFTTFEWFGVQQIEKCVKAGVAVSTHDLCN